MYRIEPVFYDDVIYAPALRGTQAAWNAAIVFVSVPNVVGSNIDIAQQILLLADLQPVVTYGTSSQYANGIVFSQFPQGGTRVLPGVTVSIEVSTGPGPPIPPPPAGMVYMPSVVGVNFYMAQEILQEAGVYIPPYYFSLSTISVVVVSGAVSDGQQQGQPSGIVTAQSIAAGIAVKPGTPLTLTMNEFPISLGFP